MRPLLTLAAALAALLPFPARSQPVTWEKLPFLYDDGGGPVDSAEFLGFLSGSATDTLVVTGNDGFFVFHPGAGGGEGTWERRCRRCSGVFGTGLITEGGTLFVAPGAATEPDRSTDRGYTWQESVIGDGYPCQAFHQSALPALQGPAGGALLCSVVSTTYRSFGDGAPGTWEQAGRHGGDGIAYGEVPPSAALPGGRLLAGVYNGVTASDDGGVTWAPTSLYGFAQYIARSFAWVPEAGHPYRGAALAAVIDLTLGHADSSATVWRSDDGGSTWALAHQFSPTAHGIPDQGTNQSGVPIGHRLREADLYTASDGVVWAGLFADVAGPSAGNGGIARSTDGGRTWEVAAGPGSGWTGRGVRQITEGADGRLYVAAEEGGVWRSVEPVVAVAAAPELPAPADLALTVEPNPSTSQAAVRWRQASAGAARVSVFDARGREVLVVSESYRPSGEHRVEVDASGLAPGAYVVRVVAPSGSASGRLSIVR